MPVHLFSAGLRGVPFLDPLRTHNPHLPRQLPQPIGIWSASLSECPDGQAAITLCLEATVGGVDPYHFYIPPHLTSRVSYK